MFKGENEMKKTLKTLMTLGLASVMLFTTAITSFAADYAEDGNRLKLYGQVLQQVNLAGRTSSNNIHYLAIVDGSDAVTKDDFAPVDSTKSVDNILYIFNYRQELEFQECTYDEIKYFVNSPGIWSGDSAKEEAEKFHEIESKFKGASYVFRTRVGDDMNEYDDQAFIHICKLPEGKTAADMGEFAEYVVYADGASTSDTSNTTTSTQDTGDWASNETGWWIQFKDGSYLTNSWWQSPYSGLWYYMGADGYMVTNTTIDGYTINADGVWVQ